MPRRSALREAVAVLMLMLGMVVPFGCMGDQGGHTGSDTGGPGAGRIGQEQVGPGVGEATSGRTESGSSSLGGGEGRR